MNKLTINKVALGSLRRRRGQYRAMILGAGLAIFFVSSLFLSVQSVYETYRLAHIGRVGTEDAVLRDAERITPEALLQSGLVTDVGSVYVTGETEESRCPVGYYDEAGAVMADRQLIQGRLPEREGELCAEPDFLQKLRQDAALGGKIELTLRIPSGALPKFLPQPVKKTYTLVGILSPQSPYMEGTTEYDDDYQHYPSAITSDKDLVEPGGRAIVHRFVQLAPGVRLDQLDDWAAEEFGLRNTFSTVFSLFSTDVQNAEANANGMIMIVIACVLGIVLVLAACLGIVNAFSGSLNQRRSQIGMMRAVGATSRQIRNIFGREALMLAVLIAPPAIALSYLLVWGLTRWIGSVSFHANPWFLPLDFLASIACVALAAFIPLRSASKLPPMQAIRDVSLLRARRQIKVRAKARYDAPRLIASRHLSLYKTRQSGIAIMVALSMLMIAVAMPFVTGLWYQPPAYGYEIKGYGGPRDYYMETNMNAHIGLNDADIQELQQLPLVSRVDSAATVQINLLVDEVTPYAAQEGSGWNGESEQSKRFKAEFGLTKEVLTSELIVFDEEFVAALSPYVVEGKLDMAALNAGKEVLVYAPEVFYFSRTVREDGSTISYSVNPIKGMPDVKTFTNDMYRAGDELSILRLHMPGDAIYPDDDWMPDYHAAGVQREDAAPRIGALLGKDAREALNQQINSSIGGLITTHQGVAAMGLPTAGVINIGIQLSAAPDEATHEYLTDSLKGIAARGAQMVLYNNIETDRNSKFWQAVTRACLLALALLVLSMCVSLVNNAITNRVRSEKRAIGTLRAVGAPLTDIVHSYRLQALSMVGWGVLGGVALAGCYYAWYYAFTNWEALPVQFGSVALAEAAFLGAVALLCGINLSIRVREIMRDSIVSNIREL